MMSEFFIKFFLTRGVFTSSFFLFFNRNYLAEQGEKAVGLLNAAMMVSVCFEPFKGTESLEKKGLNLMLNRHLANCLVESVKEAHHHFVHSKLWDLDHVYKSKTVKEFDERFTCHQFGYRNVR